MTETYSNDAQLREEDAELFSYSDVSWKRKHVRAANDIRRDLERHGYLEGDTHEIVDDSQAAEVTLAFTATEDGSLSLPEGTIVRDVTHLNHGAVEFSIDEAATADAGDTATVNATAVATGEVYNIGPGELQHTTDDVENLEQVTNPEGAEGGRDHQLARASVYRVFELVMMDFAKTEEDSFEYKRKLYRRMYRDEIDRLVASGVDIDATGDGESQDGLAHGFHGLRRS